jgi:hypothetical protein
MLIAVMCNMSGFLLVFGVLDDGYYVRLFGWSLSLVLACVAFGFSFSIVRYLYWPITFFVKLMSIFMAMISMVLAYIAITYLVLKGFR